MKNRKIVNKNISSDEVDNKEIKMNDVIIHIGMHKTGTTFLQENVFKKLDGVNLMRCNYINMFVKDGVKNLISNESFSICPYPVKYCLYPDVSHRKIVLNRLKDCFGDAKIIVGIRKNSEDWLRSLYSEYIKDNGLYNYIKFKSMIDPSFLDHEVYVDTVRSMFSEVYSYEFEDFKEDQHQIISSICNFIGVDVPCYRNVVVNTRINSDDYVRHRLYGFIQKPLYKILKG